MIGADLGGVVSFGGKRWIEESLHDREMNRLRRMLFEKEKWIRMYEERALEVARLRMSSRRPGGELP